MKRLKVSRRRKYLLPCPMARRVKYLTKVLKCLIELCLQRNKYPDNIANNIHEKIFQF
jgi:hypothetical protein